MSKMNDAINTDLKKAGILIVDDETANVRLLEKMLVSRRLQQCGEHPEPRSGFAAVSATQQRPDFTGS